MRDALTKIDQEGQLPARDGERAAGRVAGYTERQVHTVSGAYFDWSSPTMLDTLSQNIQLVYAGEMTPEDFTKAVDTDRDAFLAQQG